jgi:hypothetical protein
LKSKLVALLLLLLLFFFFFFFFSSCPCSSSPLLLCYVFFSFLLLLLLLLLFLLHFIQSCVGEREGVTARKRSRGVDLNKQASFSCLISQKKESQISSMKALQIPLPIEETGIAANEETEGSFWWE